MLPFLLEHTSYSPLTTHTSPLPIAQSLPTDHSPLTSYLIENQQIRKISKKDLINCMYVHTFVL